MTLQVDTYMRLPYAVEVVPDTTTDGALCYLASHPELPGCMAHGDTIEEALENLEDARRLYIATMLKRGLDIPEPRTPTAASEIRREVIWTSVKEIAGHRTTDPGLTEAGPYTTVESESDFKLVPQ